jgi:hypothetical protein
MRRHRPRGMLCEPDIRAVPVFIYGLCESGDSAIHYVGRSSDPRNRISSHVNHGGVRVQHWARAVMKRGRTIEIVILRTVQPGEDATPAELSAIRGLEARGEPLLNYHGMLRPLPKIYGKRDIAFVRECAELGIDWAYRWMSSSRVA